MSAMNSQAAVRRPVAQRPAPAAAPAAFEHSDLDQSLKLHLADIPKQQTGLDIEGLKPSFLSRIVDLFTRS